MALLNPKQSLVSFLPKENRSPNITKQGPWRIDAPWRIPWREPRRVQRPAIGGGAGGVSASVLRRCKCSKEVYSSALRAKAKLPAKALRAKACWQKVRRQGRPSGRLGRGAASRRGYLTERGAAARRDGAQHRPRRTRSPAPAPHAAHTAPRKRSRGGGREGSCGRCTARLRLPPLNPPAGGARRPWQRGSSGAQRACVRVVRMYAPTGDCFALRRPQSRASGALQRAPAHRPVLNSPYEPVRVHCAPAGSRARAECERPRQPFFS